MFNMYDIALNIATKAHKGQVDKNGVDYIEHPKFVSSLCDNPNEKIVALLHDVIEDTDVILDELATYGFSSEILIAIDLLTKKEDVPNDVYLSNIKKNILAKNVKIADLKHNSMISRYSNPTIKDINKCIEYLNKIKYLIAP